MNNKLLLFLCILSSAHLYAMDIDPIHFQQNIDQINEYFNTCIKALLDNNPNLTQAGLTEINKFIWEHYFLEVSEHNAARLDAIHRNLEKKEVDAKKNFLRTYKNHKVKN